MFSYVLPSLFLFVAILVSWLGGPALRLQDGALIAFRACILLAGVVAAIAVYRLSNGGRKENMPTHAGSASELASLLRLAQQRLGSAKIGSLRSFQALPALYVLGGPNTAKTTMVLKSGLDPELLAGNVYQDEAVQPTHFANIWYAQEALLIDAGEELWRDTSLWSMLVRRTSPRLLRSVLSPTLPLRAAVVCVSCESFFGESAAESASALGRNANAALRRIASQLGRELPVYVILTKLDRVPGFVEYVRNLNANEALEPLGVSIPRGSFHDGVYAERASIVMSSALDQLFFSLGEFRLELLGREAASEHVPSIYQFPRELQKLRSNLVAYLIELTRPSHLQSNPVLRGFYSTGVRAHALEEMLSAPAEVPRRALVTVDATQIFSPREMERVKAPDTSPLVTRRVAQWCFLPRLFPEILLSGEGRKENSTSSSRVSLLRRAGLATLSFALVAWLVCLTISDRNNLSLERSIRSAETALPSMAEVPKTLASVTQLSALDRLRTVLLQLEDYQHDGAPLMYRWGLYHGSRLLSPTRKLYFARFRSLLLTTTQDHLVRTLDALPASAPSNADYLAAYNPLRAYLISTSNPEHSTADFLAPVLLRFWLNGQHPSTNMQEELASKQFRFYAAELRVTRLYDIAPSGSVVARARQYLNSFGDFKRMYQGMLAAANRTHPDIDFNRLFPGSATTVLETHVIPGAFSRPGFVFMQNAIAHPERYFTGESWVLGEQAPLTASAGSLSQKLNEQYASDFIAQWQTYLHSAFVIRYRSLSDAREKLQSLSAPNSALLALLAVASRNTASASQEIAHRFQPVQAVEPGNLTDRLIAPANAAYMSGLTNLQGALAQFAQDPSAANNPTLTQPVIAAAVTAHAAVSQTAQAFDIDRVGHVEQTLIKLLQEPITDVEEMLRRAAPAQVNSAGRAFCSSFEPLLTKFPFDRNAMVEATPVEVTEALKPATGLLWQFYEANLKSLLVQQGSQWIVTPNAGLKPTPAFVQFFNRVARLSNAMFSNGGSTPVLTFTTRILRSPGIQSVTLALGTQRLSGSDVSRQFTWTAQSAQSAELIASYGQNELPLQFSGPWALFHLVDRGRVEQSADPLRLAYPLEISGTPILVNGIPLTERIEFSGPAASVLTPGSLAGMHCVAQVAR